MYHPRHADAAAELLALLKANFKLKEMGEPEKILSLQIYRNRPLKTLCASCHEHQVQDLHRRDKQHLLI